LKAPALTSKLTGGRDAEKVIDRIPTGIASGEAKNR
jgi:hypothetical protein